MKFILTATETVIYKDKPDYPLFTIEQQEITGVFGNKFSAWRLLDTEIEISTLDELIDFVRQVDEQIIISIVDNELYLEVYNGYRE